MIFKRNKIYWYNFRWTIRNADGATENFRIVRSARTGNPNDARDVESGHRHALRLGEVHPNDPWPKPVAAPVSFRPFAKRFLEHVKMHNKPGTHTFYETCLGRILNFAGIADAPLDAVTGVVVSRYARYRQEVPKNSAVTINGDRRDSHSL